MDDLQSLVRKRLDHLWIKHRITAAQAVQRAVDAGFRINKVRLSQIKTTPPGERLGLPHHEFLYGIAAALDLPDEEVVDAALRSLGHVVPVRLYAYDMNATEGRICVDCPPRTGSVDELVLVLPRSDLTRKEIAELVKAFDRAAARMLERRSRSE